MTAKGMSAEGENSRSKVEGAARQPGPQGLPKTNPTPEELALALARKIVDQMFDARFYMNARGAALEAALLAIQEATELTARFIEPDSGFLTDEELRNAAKADALRRNDHLKQEAV